MILWLKKRFLKVKKISFLDFPNLETKVDIIKTTKNGVNASLLSKFKIDLKKDKFKIKTLKVLENTSYNNCDDNIEIQLKGTGITSYYVKRIEAKPEKYYPDFVLIVQEFENEIEANIGYAKIKKALYSYGFCNGKEPRKLLIKENTVFCFSTRAEMFRGYINDFAKKIEKYQL